MNLIDFILDEEYSELNFELFLFKLFNGLSFYNDLIFLLLLSERFEYIIFY